MFSIRDPHAELAPESKERIEELANRMLGCVDDVAHDPLEALQALAAVVAFTLCEGFLSRKSADNALSVVMMVIVSSMDQAEKDSNTNWSQKTAH